MKRSLSIKQLFILVVVVEIALMAFVLYVHEKSGRLQERLEAAQHERFEMSEAADELRQSSDDLTRFARTYVVTGNRVYKENFYRILDIRDGKAPRPKNYHTIYWDFDAELRARLHPDGDPLSLEAELDALPFTPEERNKLKVAKRNSDALVNLEEEAFNAIEGRFKDARGDYTVVGKPDRQRAITLLHSDEYHAAKQQIMRPINDFLLMVDARSNAKVRSLLKASKQSDRLLKTAVINFIAANLFIFFILHRRIISVIVSITRKIERSKKQGIKLQHFDIKFDDELATMVGALNQMREETQLLEQYREIVDQSAIVSKTNPAGVITYVNDSFERISGFTSDELIGKPHNIVRHPDMPSEVFEEMWHTIKAKKSWSGIVMNRKKNGDAYWVDTIINPIVGSDGRITEYIALRYDITELETIRKHLAEELNISNKNFSEAYRLSAEYEKAIDASTILSRTDSSGKITYVNDRFCAISGYSREELLGRTHRIIRHPENSETFYNLLWKSIRAGHIWKGQMTNRAKDGHDFHVDMSIVPIMDTEGNILEFMAIRHDITQIIELHTELEETQKEVIYKMGEIGERRSEETGNHVKRVAEYSKLLALKAGLSLEEAEILFAASPMHDIGKVGIPDMVLKKPGRLDQEEWQVMQTHANIGYTILRSSERPILKAAATVAHEHHERWDGTGYPRGLKGDEIHIYGRITAIADVFDALGTDRVYKKAWELEKILDLLREESGKQFDPELVSLFLENLDEFLAIQKRFKEK
jgi:PAS domain S-box-containing protein